MNEILFLLLPVAAASGWWLAQREQHRKRHPRAGHPTFLRGLDYLLDEQPDKAIDMFLELAEVDGETVETHLALGSLFRRRGEVDRAIRIHQNLIARKNLDAEQRGYALLELGQDYMSAGLLDRAETLFQELVGLGLHDQRALQGLLDLYQQERDWDQCLKVAERLQVLGDGVRSQEIAHYHCELAELARRDGDMPRAHAQLQAALEADPHCVRATIVQGRAAFEAGDAEQAVTLFRQVADQRCAYLPEILPTLLAALRQLGEPRLLQVLGDLADRHPGSALMLTWSEVLLQARGHDAAIDALAGYLRHYADLPVLERLFSLELAHLPLEKEQNARAATALEVVRRIVAHLPRYQCEQCGFQAHSLHWQCPSCKRWGSVVPVHPETIIGDEVLHAPRLA